ncbi:Protein Gawky, partial [Fragariocoptes setiger]
CQPEQIEVEHENHHQQQQQQQNSATTKQERNLLEDLYSTKPWGQTAVRQDTPWQLNDPSPTPQASSGNGSSGSAKTIKQSSVNLQDPIVTQQVPFLQKSNNQSYNLAAQASTLSSTSVSGLPPGISQSNDAFRSNSIGSQSLPCTINDGFRNEMLGANQAACVSNLQNSWRSNQAAPRAGSGFGPPANRIQMNIGANPSLNNFARAPGPMAPKSEMVPRSSGWSYESNNELGWPSQSIDNSSQGKQPNAYNLGSDFDSGKPGYGSNAWTAANKSLPSVSSYNNSSSGGMTGTWSPVPSSGGMKSGSHWDGDGSDDPKRKDSELDDGTAIWGSSDGSKAGGVNWGDKISDMGEEDGANNDKDRNSANSQSQLQHHQQQQQQQAFRPHSSEYSSTSLLMSSATSSSNHPSRGHQQQRTQHQQQQQVMNQSLMSQNFDQSSALNNQSSGQPNRESSNNVPSTQQLKQMVQQIQLAVQAGHLNAQILNQPLAPMTLHLLYQLLQQIRILHNLQSNKSGNPPTMVTSQLAKTKQNIINLQNQITAQQAVYTKQNSQSHNLSSQAAPLANMSGASASAISNVVSQPKDNFRNSIEPQNVPNSMNDGAFRGGADLLSRNSSSSMDELQNSWRSLHIGSGFGSSSSANSRPPMSLSGGSAQNDFTRAPGPIASKPNVSMPRSSAWSYETDNGLRWPPQSEVSSGNQGKQSNAFDMVPEFEPGKPWRGSMLMKNVEDDPTITPGSIARSLMPHQQQRQDLIMGWSNNNSAAKQTSPTSNIPNSTNSTDQFCGLPLQNNPWAYSSSSAQAGSISFANSGTNNSTHDNSRNDSNSVAQHDMTLDKMGNMSGSSSSNNDLLNLGNKPQQSAFGWGSISSSSSGQDHMQSSDINNKARPGPPPGLGNGGSVKNNSSGISNGGVNDGVSNQDGNMSNVWGSNISAHNNWNNSQPNNNGSHWLLLRNITPQVDSNALKLLCRQHGPMQLFHLYLNFAIARYSTSEEAAKAQSTLNNCVINNTSIIADTPSDLEVQHYLQLGQNGQQVGNW